MVMKIVPGGILHIYNRGNNKQPIFFNEGNYFFFLDKIHKHIGTVSDILGYCLMPNHFHFLIQINERSCTPKKIGSLESTELQNGFRMMQSSYASAVNKQFERTGSLFQQNTKYKLLESDKYIETCFHYIHQNPLKAELVSKLEDWRYSSFREYIYPEQTRLCNQDALFRLLDISSSNFYETSYGVIKEELLEKIF